MGALHIPKLTIRLQNPKCNSDLGLLHKLGPFRPLQMMVMGNMLCGDKLWDFPTGGNIHYTAAQTTC